MLKRKAIFFISLWRISDIALHAASFVAAYMIRFDILGEDVTEPRALSDLIYNLFVLLLLWVVFSNALGVYQSKRLSGFSADWLPIFYSQTAVVISYTSIGFVLKALDLSRIMLAIYSFIAIVIIGFIHQFVRIYLNYARVKGYNQRHILIVGAGKIGRELALRLSDHLEYGLKIIGFIDDKKLPGKIRETQYEVIGNTRQLQEILLAYDIDRVMITLPLTSHRKVAKVADICDYVGVEVNIVPDLFGFIKPNTKVFDIDGLPVIGIRKTPVDSILYIYFKRLFDILFSIIVLAVLSPAIFIFALLIKLTSSGPVIFKQNRIGSGGRDFIFYKFRTMAMSDEKQSDTIWTTENDSRCTKIGTFLRKTSLDELPQFWNVLKGDMSVVGPRPERPHFAKKFKSEVPKYMVRHQVKTGITGWAQVNGFRGDTSIEKRLEYDLYYIENWSFKFDLKIIWLTVWKGLINKNAY
ncbi:undecaprenyl-phosphate glucose phosphotransferase [bacterium]|nr:undecaprenyl-phosphate glucose phosphotransferase [bacterium]